MGIMKHRKAMSGLGIVALVSACIVMLFVSCDAESIMNTGSTLGILSSAGLGNAGDKVVNSAADTTASFVEQYEQCIDWSDYKESSGGKDVPGNIMWKLGGETGAKAHVTEFISKVTKASATSSSDKAIKAAFAKRYSGMTGDWDAYTLTGDFIDSWPMLTTIFSILPSFGVIIPPETMTKIRAYELPFPIQVFDVMILMNKILQLAASNSDLIQWAGKGGSGGGGGGEGGSSFDASLLLAIPENIKKSVNGRTYQTDGDKIAGYLVYDIVDQVSIALGKFNTAYPEDKSTDFPHLKFDWFLGNCRTNIDRILSDLSLIAYIYDFHLDTASIISSAIGK